MHDGQTKSEMNCTCDWIEVLQREDHLQTKQKKNRQQKEVRK